MRFQMLSGRATAEVDFVAKLPRMWISPGAVTSAHLLVRRARGRGFSKPLVSEEINTSTRGSRRHLSFELEAGSRYEFAVWMGSHVERFDVASLAPSRYQLSVSAPSYLGAYAKPNGFVEVRLRGPGLDDRRHLATRWWRVIADGE